MKEYLNLLLAGIFCAIAMHLIIFLAFWTCGEIPNPVWLCVSDVFAWMLGSIVYGVINDY